ncbi:response regulator [Cyclonatronum proteinivorum]|nr:response regulator [Cyclonatronum proteinivorum]
MQYRSLVDRVPASTGSIPFLHDSAPVGTQGAMIFIGLQRAYFYHPAADSVRVLSPSGSFYSTGYAGGFTWLTDTETGLHIVADDGRLVHVETPFPPDNNRIIALQNQAAVFTMDHRLWIYETDGRWTLSGVFEYYADKDAQHVLSAGSLADGRVMISSMSGVQIFNQEGELQHNFNSSNVLPFDISGKAFEASDGTLWVTSPVGLAAVSLGSPLRYFPSSRGLPDQRINAFAEWNNAVYVGADAGLWIRDGSEFTQVIGNVAIFDMQESPMGLLAASSRGLLLFDEAGNMQQLSDDFFVRFIFADPHYPETFYFYESPKALHRVVLKEDGSDSEFLFLFDLSLTPFSFVKVSDEELWVSTRDFGVFQFQTRSDANGIAEVTDSILWNEESGLPGLGAISLFSYQDGVAFLTDEGVFTPDTGRQILLPHPHFRDLNFGTTNSHIWPIIQFDTGAIAGRVAPSVFPLLIPDDDGPAAETASYTWRKLPFGRTHDKGAFIKFAESSTGRLYGLQRGGLSYLKPGWEQHPAGFDVPPRMQLTGITLAADSVLHQGWSAATEDLSPNVSFRLNSLRFNWSLLSFEPNALNRYQFRLLGADTEWSAWTAETFADYRNLREGSYTFEVRGRDLYNRVSEAAVFSFTVQPPWYRSVFAYMFYIFLVAGLVAGSIQWRTRKLLARQQELEREVAARTSEIEQKNEQLEKLDKVKSTFFSNVSHEFRTPLTLIKGPVERLMADSSLSKAEKIREYERILENANRLLSLVDQILNLSKMESGTYVMQLRRLDLNALLLRIAEWYRELATRKGLQFTLDVPAKPFWIHAEAEQVELLFSNLLSNAVKYTKSGGITLRCIIKNQTAEVVIEDTGIGIPAGEQSRIFDRYYRAQSGLLSSSGAGIGLNLVKYVAGMHGMDVSLKSAEQKGTTFTIQCPAGVSHIKARYVMLEDDESIPAAPQYVTGGEDQNRVTAAPIKESPKSELPEDPAAEDIPLLLLADDNADIRTFIRTTLGSGYRYAECADGHQLVQQAVTLQPDLILSDVMMPGLDGIAASRQLKDNPDTAHIPIIMITAKGGNHNELTGLESGANDYITKPFSPAILQARVLGQINLLMRLRRYLQQQFKAAYVSFDAIPESESEPEPDPASASETETTVIPEWKQKVDAALHDPDFSVQDMANMLALSRSSLNRLFNKEFGISPNEYMRKRRIELSCDMISRKEGSISEIAYAAGFSSVSYFSRVFKQLKGVSPTEYANS